ncbi:hypothetical protein AYO20_11732 [Fonsecaea nubica]|uniref:Uncharacterized protein n=1 Tax=Fonsecaea nubica TaxID=856822 RepID=A0A178BLX8_9EURO|nr:hypothetical protein AYO20_11732 [Fonsecaea nubica]OAL18639.1 hypothetical protein AYO20_11732 [Fonsecaea nubica]
MSDHFGQQGDQGQSSKGPVKPNTDTKIEGRGLPFMPKASKSGGSDRGQSAVDTKGKSADAKGKSVETGSTGEASGSSKPRHPTFKDKGKGKETVFKGKDKAKETVFKGEAPGPSAPRNPTAEAKSESEWEDEDDLVTAGEVCLPLDMVQRYNLFKSGNIFERPGVFKANPNVDFPPVMRELAEEALKAVFGMTQQVHPDTMPPPGTPNPFRNLRPVGRFDEQGNYHQLEPPNTDPDETCHYRVITGQTHDPCTCVSPSDDEETEMAAKGSASDKKAE